MMNARYLISSLMELSGANAATLATRRASLTVLCYHRVLDANDAARATAHPAMVTCVHVFEQQMEIIVEQMRPVTLAEVLSWLDGHGGLPDRAVLVTFDDGWADTYANAFPVMRRLGVPGLVFLATGLVGTNERQWADAAYASLVRRSGVATAEREVERLKSLSLRERALQCEPPEPRAESPNLTWRQVEEMAAHGFGFGSHTHSHLILPREAEERVRDELRSSAERIRRRLGREPVAFAYPDGQFDGASELLVEQAGHSLAFTSDEGLVTPKSPRFALPRLGVHDGVSTTPAGGFSRSMFTTYLAGTIPWRYRRRVR